MSYRRVAAALLVGTASALYLRLGRAYPWPLAAIVGVAAALLVGIAFQTGDRLRNLRR
ncbi:MAG: hypothetical protein H6511_03790 [Holophagales bacterium]|nr:hypothetical protein [Holophagales bacterium]